MRIKLNHRWAGPDHSYPAGTVLDLPEDQAKYFLESRQAEAVDATPVLRADPAQPQAIPAPKARKPRTKKTPVESSPEAEPISEAEPEADVPTAPED